MVRLPKELQEPEDFLMSLAENVRKLRLKRGLSQTQLAAQVGIAHPRISELENGRSNPTVRTLQAIADELEVDIARLFKKTKISSLT